jgi:predicted O-methyltransferase YrrM
METPTDYVKYFWDKNNDLYHDNTNTCMKSLMTTLNSLLRINQNATILEAGCGPGVTSKMISNDCRNDACLLLRFSTRYG